jgi:hypothetical protein
MTPTERYGVFRNAERSGDVITIERVERIDPQQMRYIISDLLDGYWVEDADDLAYISDICERNEEEPYVKGFEMHIERSSNVVITAPSPHFERMFDPKIESSSETSNVIPFGKTTPLRTKEV